MANQPLLSICIPTYNRPKEFERMFKGVLAQLTPDMEKDIEIFVRDDSSNLDTKNVFDRLTAARNLNVQYIKGEKIGLDAANLFSIENAKGTYLWWFSDDDEMQDNAIASIVEILKKYPELTYIWVNFDHIHRGNPAVHRMDGFFKDHNDVLISLGVNIGLVTTHVFKREIALGAVEKTKKHIVGFSFAGLVPILHVLSQPGRFYFANGPYILCHPTTQEEIIQITTKTGQIKNEGFNVYGVDFYNIIKEFEGSFSKYAIRRILSVNFASLWRGMLVGWIGGWDTPSGKRWKMFKLYWSYPEFWIAMPTFLMPLWINRALYRVYKLFFHERKFIFFEKLKKGFKHV